MRPAGDIPCVCHDRIAIDGVRIARSTAVKNQTVALINDVRAVSISGRGIVALIDVYHCRGHVSLGGNVVVSHTQRRRIRTKQSVIVRCRGADSVNVERPAVVVEVPLVKNNAVGRMSMRRCAAVEVNRLRRSGWIRIRREHRYRIVAENLQRSRCGIRQTKRVGHLKRNRVRRQTGDRISRIRKTHVHDVSPRQRGRSACGIVKLPVVIQVPCVRDRVAVGDVHIGRPAAIKDYIITHVHCVRTVGISHRSIVNWINSHGKRLIGPGTFIIRRPDGNAGRAARLRCIRQDQLRTEHTRGDQARVRVVLDRERQAIATGSTGSIITHLPPGKLAAPGHIAQCHNLNNILLPIENVRAAAGTDDHVLAILGAGVEEAGGGKVRIAGSDACPSIVPPGIQVLVVIGRIVECISHSFIVCRIVDAVPVECRLLDIPAEGQTCGCKRGIDAVVAVQGELVSEQSGPGGRGARYRIDLDCGIVERRHDAGVIGKHIRHIQNGIRSILIYRHIGDGIGYGRREIVGIDIHRERVFDLQPRHTGVSRPDGDFRRAVLTGKIRKRKLRTDQAGSHHARIRIAGHRQGKAVADIDIRKGGQEVHHRVGIVFKYENIIDGIGHRRSVIDWIDGNSECFVDPEHRHPGISRPNPDNSRAAVIRSKRQCQDIVYQRSRHQRWLSIIDDRERQRIAGVHVAEFRGEVYLHVRGILVDHYIKRANDMRRVIDGIDRHGERVFNPVGVSVGSPDSYVGSTVMQRYVRQSQLHTVNAGRHETRIRIARNRKCQRIRRDVEEIRVVERGRKVQQIGTRILIHIDIRDGIRKGRQISDGIDRNGEGVFDP